MREVEEETGWRCRNEGLIGEVRYHFKRTGNLVDKKVRWYRMKPISKVGKPDPLEIIKTRWFEARSMEKYLTYPSDRKLLVRYLKKNKK